jgi:dTDP-4-dehydrorhamnose 3,5-epimerase-like enzyme
MKIGASGSMVLSRLDDVRIVELPCHRRADGEVVVAEAATGVPFAIARLFILRAPQGAARGRHAHRLCSQFMICVHGAIDIDVDDGAARQTFMLDRGDRALLVPPMIWNRVAFRDANSVVAVLCDRIYEADDYVRDYDAFVRLRGGIST